MERKTPYPIPEGQRATIVVTVSNPSEAEGRFRLLGTLGKFSSRDVAEGGPLYPPGGTLNFYWGATRTPNPGNLGMSTAAGERRAEITIPPRESRQITFTTVPLAPITDWNGQRQLVLDAHWVLETWNMSTNQWEVDYQQADISALQIQVVVRQARGVIVRAEYRL